MTTAEFLTAVQAAADEVGEEITLAQFQAAANALITLPEDDTLAQWIEAVEDAVELSANTVETVKVGYIHELITGQTTYDVLLINPPSYTIANVRSWNYRDMVIKWYLIRQNKGSGSDLMTDAERNAAWSALDVVNRAILEKLTESPIYMQILGEVQVEYNSGGPAQLLPDNVIWLEVNLKLRLEDCP